MQAALYWNRKRRRAAADLKDYGPAIAAPQNLGTAGPGGNLNDYTTVAPSVLAISFSQSLAADDIIVVIGDNTYPVPALAAGEIFRLPWAEEGELVDIQRSGAPDGNVSLYVVDEWGRTRVIATGVFDAGGGSPGGVLDFSDANNSALIVVISF